MKTFDRRGWTPVTIMVQEAHVYRKGNVGMLVTFKNDEPEPCTAGYFVWGDPEVRYETEAEAFAAAEVALRMRSDERVH